MIEHITACRSCEGENLQHILSLGKTPLADALLTDEQLDQPELLVALDLVFCSDCKLVQIDRSVSPDILFRGDYLYYSSVSPTLMAHFGASARAIIEQRGLGQDHLVVEAASNDGYMLKHFVEAGVPVMGIDPAYGPAKVAQEAGIPTRCTYFSEDLAYEMREKEGVQAEVFLANNVLAHVPDLNGFIAGIRLLLSKTGVAVIEAPYLVDLIEKCEFDTIYHQHLCYFSVTALEALFRRHDLYLNDVERTTIHGGSLRLFVEPVANPKQSVGQLLKMEQELGLGEKTYYMDFAGKVKEIKRSLRGLLGELKDQGQSIAGYGAAAKAATLLAYCGIDGDILEYVADLNQRKHGWYMGGNHLPIVPTERLVEDRPDYVLILAWNFAKEIMKQQAEYREQGGRFIIPIPEPKVMGS